MMHLTCEEQNMLSDELAPATAMAMRIVVDTAKLMGANELIPITCAHVDGCVRFGDASVYFAEKLCDLGGKVTVPSSLNVGSLDLKHPGLVLGSKNALSMNKRLMDAYVDLGCEQSWTCAPYQVGYRPGLGEQIAWAESNAIVFANSVLGARTNRYGDFLDICAAITGRAPYVGLHKAENRYAQVLVDISRLSSALRNEETFYPVLGSWLGETVGSTIAAIDGIPSDVPEDHLKALAAASASTGAVALFHAIGVTPEAATREAAFGGRAPRETIVVSPEMIRAARDKLSTSHSAGIDCVALGSPHFSLNECKKLAELAEGVKFNKPVYVCTEQQVFETLGKSGARKKLCDSGAIFVVGTCIVAAPIITQSSGVLMTNSGKFAHYGPSTVNHEIIYGSLADCVNSAVSGRVEREESLWM